MFPDFDESLRETFKRETELFIESVIREDRDAIDLLSANYTFVNERLAKHYVIPNVYGTDFRRVMLTDDYSAGSSDRWSEPPPLERTLEQKPRSRQCCV